MMNACFFDMDGTLIDSREDLAGAVNHTRRDLGLAELAVDEVMKSVGRGSRYLLEHAISERADEADRLWELFMSHYHEHLLDRTVLYPGVRQTLVELKSRGWLLGVNTAKPAAATRTVLEHFGLWGIFEGAVIAGGDCPEMKPSALPLRECAARMHGHRLSAYDWMVGDSWTDMQCATNAGVKGAFCAFGFGELRDSRYTVRLRRMDELLTYLRAEE